jgi:hypothetical protein
VREDGVGSGRRIGGSCVAWGMRHSRLCTIHQETASARMWRLSPPRHHRAPPSSGRSICSALRSGCCLVIIVCCPANTACPPAAASVHERLVAEPLAALRAGSYNANSAATTPSDLRGGTACYSVPGAGRFSVSPGPPLTGGNRTRPPTTRWRLRRCSRSCQTVVRRAPGDCAHRTHDARWDTGSCERCSVARP